MNELHENSFLDYMKDSLNERKGETATTIGPHGRSSLTKKQRKELKSNKPDEQDNTPKQEEEKPSSNSQEEYKDNDTEKLSAADIDEDTLLDAAKHIVVPRVSLFNENMEMLYKIAGNILYCRKPVFPIFDIEEVQNHDEEQKHEQKSTDFMSALQESVTLLEDDERNSQEKEKQKVKRFLVRISFPDTSWKENAFTKRLYSIAKNVGIKDKWNNLSNIGRLCATVGALNNKYSELLENIKEVNSKIPVDKIKLEASNIDFSLNNKLLTMLLEVFHNTPGALVLNILNEFSSRSLSKIVAADSLENLMKLLPYKLSESNAKKISSVKDAFEIEIEEGTAAWKLFVDERFRNTWLNISSKN